MYTPHTVTLYNVQIEVDLTTMRETEKNYITILDGVFLDESKGTNVRESGLESADSAVLYIPFSVKAKDAETGNKKTFVQWDDFAKSEDKSGIWTLDTGRNTHFIRGVVVDQNTNISTLQMTHDGVYIVTKVDAKDYGAPAMRHWEVGGA